MKSLGGTPKFFTLKRSWKDFLWCRIIGASLTLLKRFLISDSYGTKYDALIDLAEKMKWSA
ncbi:hypothetical protein K458DRAFT_382289 [Lentithecium fluviatile CBS 122367]|uniref:Uncharacterized protein n=1 Tax=Lentithecium fluviatile CBS 122367 TaxID=1168545 RepID=A0A6G1JJI0_9PLEO|nr:hypothetical protein K458DRAFT_382289 [Lentithecium fluviatile CBS 122367]